MYQPTPGSRFGLVLSGGGIRFATHAGMLEEMAAWQGPENHLWLRQFQVVVGTSAGALYAGLFCAGYSPAQIALIAELFASPALGKQVFDANFAGAAAALVRHDLSYVRGLVRGRNILSLLETVLSKVVYGRLGAIDPGLPGARAEAAGVLADAWRTNRGRPRNRDYYAGLLTFADCSRELFLIGVNAYNGQKTVFCRVDPDPKAGQDQDQKLYSLSRLAYLNAMDRILAEVQARSTQLAEELKKIGAPEPVPLSFRRFETRVYRQFDPSLYGPQLPLALAVRASISLPFAFEPVRIQRAIPAGSTIRENDFFLDGGVEENLGLGVAANPYLGNSTHMLGIFLGNRGYRLPDVNALNNVITILLKTTEYLGEAVLDQQQHNTDLANRHITVLSALSALDADLTDTNAIPRLIDEGREIARDFWSTVHRNASYPGESASIDMSDLFSFETGIQVYLSPAARSGPAGFLRLKLQGPQLPDLKLSDVVLGLGTLFTGGQGQVVWRVLYAALFLISFGLVSLISSLILSLARVGAPIGVGELGAQAVVALALVILIRWVAYQVWLRGRAQEPI